MADEDRPVGADKPRNNIYTVMLLVTAVAYILALTLAIIELNDTHSFRYQLFGSKEYPEK